LQKCINSNKYYRKYIYPISSTPRNSQRSPTVVKTLIGTPGTPYRGGMGLFRMIIRPFLRLLLIIPVFVSKNTGVTQV